MDTASSVCKMITGQAEGHLHGFFLILRSNADIAVTEEELPNVLTEYYQDMMDRMNGQKNEKWKKLKQKGWLMVNDTLNDSADSEQLHIEMIKKEIYESREGKSTSISIKVAGEPDSIRTVIFSDLLNAQKVEFPETTVEDTFKRMQRAVAITAAAINDKVFFDALYRVITTFPDSVFAITADIATALSYQPPNNDIKSVNDSFFKSENYYSIDKGSAGARVLRSKRNVFYISFGGAAEHLLIQGIASISNDNAIIPDSFLERYALDGLRPKKEYNYSNVNV